MLPKLVLSHAPTVSTKHPTATSLSTKNLKILDVRFSIALVVGFPGWYMLVNIYEDNFYLGPIIFYVSS